MPTKRLANYQRQVETRIWTCDGCEGEFVESVTFSDDNGIRGYWGTVIEVTETGGSGTVEWYAHDIGCIASAILGAIARS